MEPIKEKIKIFLQDSLFFVVTDNKMDRSTFRKALMQRGVAQDKILLFERREAALAAMEAHAPFGLLCSGEIKGESAANLIKAFREINPKASQSVCVVLGNKDEDPALWLASLKAKADKLLPRPYTAFELNSALDATLERKANMNKLARALDEAFAQLEAGELESVERFLTNGRLPENNPDLMLLKALYFQAVGKLDDALSFCRMAEGPDSDYRIQVLHFDLLYQTSNYSQAFELLQEHWRRFPMDPSHVDKVIKLCLRVKKHDAIAKVADQSFSQALQDQNLAQTLAAGLAVSSKFLAAQNKGLAVDSSVKAVKLGRGRKRIVERGLANLCDLGEFEKVKSLVLELSQENDSQEAGLKEALDVAEYRSYEHEEESAARVYQRGMDLTNRGNHDFHVYDILLKAGLKAGGKKELLAEKAKDAAHHHPQKTKYFKTLLAG